MSGCTRALNCRNVNILFQMSGLNLQEARKMKRSLFAGRISPQPLETFPGPLRKKIDLRSALAPPLRQPAAAVGGEGLIPPGAVPFSTAWLHTPVPLRWRPALVLQMAVKDGPDLAVPIPWYAINGSSHPP